MGESATVSPAEFEAASYDFAEVRAIAAALELADPVAIALVRRGHRTVEQARVFLEADERHSFELFEGIGDAVALVASTISAGTRITVHGDYDVDGMAATAILVGAMRELGGDCDWIIPDRLADGYGLSAGTVAELAERGTSLLITVDCGIASAQEVAIAKAHGMEVIVTDHHQPGERLPDCPIVHPLVSRYPFAGLCGTAVAGKLAEAVAAGLGAEPRSERDLDLLALATVADMVPLLGENRAIVRRGLAQIRRRPRAGLAALMAVASVEAERIDEGDIGFRLAPRLNAAGRLYRADAGVELLLCEDPARAAEIARELDNANHERRDTEREVLHAAEAALRELPSELREAQALVLAGEGWHPGVVGIVASRIAERHDKPAIVISLDEEGKGRGSGRSRGDFDLLEGLRACADHLVKFGGHKAAAGLEIDADELANFRRAFATHAATVIAAGGPAASERVDAIVGADALGLDVAEQLARLGPFGIGNPGVRFLVPWARLSDVRSMGTDGGHARFNLMTGTSSARGVAFRVGQKLAKAAEDPHDLTISLELNHWNGAVEPRAVLGKAQPVSQASGEERDARSCECGGPLEAATFWQRFESTRAGGGEEIATASLQPAAARTIVKAHGGGIVARISELVSSGDPVLVICADASRRADLAVLAANPIRFGGSRACVCRRCPDRALKRAADTIQGSGPSLLLADWVALAREPGIATAFRHAIAVDPPASRSQRAVLESAGELSGEGYLHEIWGAPELELSSRLLAEEWLPRAALAEVFRAAREQPLAGAELESALRGPGRHSRPAETAARCVQVLEELGLAKLDGAPSTRVLRVVSSERTELERSSAWRRFEALHEERLRFLQDQRQS